MSTFDDTLAPPIPFSQTLHNHGLRLVRAETHTLQVNTGLLCNIACRHCHLEAGPQRTEIMPSQIMAEVVAYAARVRFSTIDITGGAPELIPGIGQFLTQLASLTGRCMFRTNLVALNTPQGAALIPIFRDLQVHLVASLPATSSALVAAQRGPGVWEQSCAMLRHLNQQGYGLAESGLDLDLAVNPGGAFLAADQAQTEARYRRALAQIDIAFNRLFTFNNVILGRYRDWLIRSGNLADYSNLLVERFHPAAVCGVMCRSQILVGWDGILYDCDFNLAAGLAHGGVSRHVSTMDGIPTLGSSIVTGNHCYACTAGAGFT